MTAAVFAAKPQDELAPATEDQSQPTASAAPRRRRRDPWTDPNLEWSVKVVEPGEYVVTYLSDLIVGSHVPASSATSQPALSPPLSSPRLAALSPRSAALSPRSAALSPRSPAPPLSVSLVGPPRSAPLAGALRTGGAGAPAPRTGVPLSPRTGVPLSPPRTPGVPLSPRTGVPLSQRSLGVGGAGVALGGLAPRSAPAEPEAGRECFDWAGVSAAVGKILDVEVHTWPDIVCFFIPGNPGVTSAYLAWARSLVDKLYENSNLRGLLVLSSHLGHMRDPAQPTRGRSCESNIEHQTTLVRRLLGDLEVAARAQSLPFPQVAFCGHSAGAFFVTNAVFRSRAVIHRLDAQRELLLHAQRDVSSMFRVVLLCGTLCRFASSGYCRAFVATKRIDWVLQTVESRWFKNRMKVRADQIVQLKQVIDEFSPDFIRQASLLCLDEMSALPKDESSQLDLLDSIGLECFFLFAARDAYVSRRTQMNILKKYGPSNVYIAKSWWHAFGIDPPSGDDCAAVLSRMLKIGKVAAKDQNQSHNHNLLTLLSGDIPLSIASLLLLMTVCLVSIPQSLRRHYSTLVDNVCQKQTVQDAPASSNAAGKVEEASD